MIAPAGTSLTSSGALDFRSSSLSTAAPTSLRALCVKTSSRGWPGSRPPTSKVSASSARERHGPRPVAGAEAVSIGADDGQPVRADEPARAALAAGQLEVHSHRSRAGRDVDESIGVTDRRVCVKIPCPRAYCFSGPLPSGGRRRTGQPSLRRLRRRRSSRGRAGPSARTPRRPAGRTRGRLRGHVIRRLGVFDIPWWDHPARHLVDQPSGHDHPRGHLDRRLDRLEPLRVIDNLRAAEERVDPLPRVDLDLVEFRLRHPIEAEAARGVGPGGDGGMRPRVGAPDDGAFDRLAGPLQADDADDRLGRAGDVVEGRADELRPLRVDSSSWNAVSLRMLGSGRALGGAFAGRAITSSVPSATPPPWNSSRAMRSRPIPWTSNRPSAPVVQVFRPPGQRGAAPLARSGSPSRASLRTGALSETCLLHPPRPRPAWRRGRPRR